jgi:hypothetical protein
MAPNPDSARVIEVPTMGERTISPSGKPASSSLALAVCAAAGGRMGPRIMAASRCSGRNVNGLGSGRLGVMANQSDRFLALVNLDFSQLGLFQQLDQFLDFS